MIGFRKRKNLAEDTEETLKKIEQGGVNSPI
jgi:hypothetical protein